jgi:photosystem II stability/assembly factor-like uncharacterized protein
MLDAVPHSGNPFSPGIGTMITVGPQIGRIIVVLVASLTAIASLASSAGERSKTYKVEEVISDLRVPTEMPGAPEKGSITQFFSPMIFVNKKVGWVNSQGFLGKTTDGGKTWMAVESRAKGDVFFLNEKLGWTGWGLYADSFGQTVNGGATWRIWKPSPVPCCGDFFFVNSEIGWALAHRGQIYHTTDGGKTWKRQSSGTISTLRALYFINRYEGWVASADGEILHTSDGGKHWEVQRGKVGVGLFTIRFWDDKIGYAVGVTPYIRGKGQQGVIIYTTDGGRNWRKPEGKLPLGKGNSGLVDVVSISAQESWVVGQRGAVLRTTDGGKHWEIISLDKPSPAPNFGSAALVEQDGREAILILASKGGLYRIWLDP